MLNEDEKSDKKSEVCILRPSKHQTPEIDTTQTVQNALECLIWQKEKIQIDFNHHPLFENLRERFKISLPLNILTPVC